MDNKELFNKYSLLLLLTEEQLKVLGVDDLQPEQAVELLLEKEALKEPLKNEIEQLNGQIQLSQEDEEALAQLISKISEKNTKVIILTESLNSRESQQSMQVKNQRKTLKAYGGLHNSDVVPLYFDEKK